jgi:membrane protein DedA with SNARE-associated domain
MHPVPFFAWSALGTLLWTGFLTAAGYVLEAHYEIVAGWIDIVSKLVVVVIAVAYIYRLIRHRADQR